jgi:hypothetical protein
VKRAVHQAAKLAAGRTLCGRELAKLPPGARVLAGDVAAADVTCRVCARHRPWEERMLANKPAAFLPPCVSCGAAAHVDRTPTGKACRVCGRVAAAAPDGQREPDDEPCPLAAWYDTSAELEPIAQRELAPARARHTCSLGGGTDTFCKACERSAPIAPSDLQAPDLELGFRASSSPVPGAMDRAIGATRSSDALYRRAVEHIASNDDPAELELKAIRSLASVALVADVWGVSVDAVARYVLRVRKR